MFLTHPCFKVGESGQFILVKPLHYFSPRFGNIEVEKDFVTDFASIPRFFRRLISVNGNHRLAAVIHDKLYSVRGKLSDDKELTRKECDEWFLEAMEVSKVGWFQRNLMYRAVRVGGWVFWE